VAGLLMKIGCCRDFGDQFIRQRGRCDEPGAVRGPGELLICAIQRSHIWLLVFRLEC
jgi:hypothetical protein